MLPYEEQIRKILRDILIMEPSQYVGVTEDLQYCGMDSLNYLQLIICLEDEFHFTVPEEQMELRNVRSIQKTSELVCQLVETV